ncbi:MAG: IreB family regulatory phosphoprotein [Bacillota bacterium]
MSDFDKTMMFKVNKEDESEVSKTLREVYQALEEKGYNPIDQIVGYILSGDPTYITSHQEARSKIRKFERDEMIEELVKNYLDK